MMSYASLNTTTVSWINGTFLSTPGYNSTTENAGNDSAALLTMDIVLGWVRDISLGCVLGFLCLLTAVGNAMVLHAVRTERNLQTMNPPRRTPIQTARAEKVSNMYIVSLAIADLTVGMIVMPISAIYIFTQDWLFGVVVCQFWIGVDYLASTASILNLFILSLDRYWSVMSPLKYLRKRTKKRALLMIASVWSVSSLWLIPIIGWHYFEHKGIRTVPNNVCDTEYAHNTALKIVTGILNYYLPLAVMYALYTKIFLEIKHRSKMEIGQRTSGTSMKFRRKDQNNDSYSGNEDSNEDQNSDAMFSSTSHGEKDRFIIQNKMVPRLILPHINNSHNRVADTDTDVLTANNTDDETGKTKVPLLRLTSHGGQQSGGDSSEQEETRFCYNYDEVVLDPTTEKVQRFYYEDNTPGLCVFVNNGVNNRQNSGSGVQGNPPYSPIKPSLVTSALLDLKETCLTSSPPENDQQDEGDHYENHVHLNVPEMDDVKMHLTFPKEHHPVKNHHIKGSKVRPENGGPFYSPPPSCLAADEEGIQQQTQTAPPPLDKSRLICPSRGDTCPNSTRSSIRSTGSLKIINQNGKRNNQQTHSRSFNSKERKRANGNSYNASSRAQSPFKKLAINFKPRAFSKKRRKMSSSLAREIKAIRQLGVIMGAFTLCFFPYFVCFMVVAFCEDCVTPQLLVAVTWIGYLNSTLNPFLYPLCNAAFRRKFRKMLQFRGADKHDGRNTTYCLHKRVNTLATRQTSYPIHYDRNKLTR